MARTMPGHHEPTFHPRLEKRFIGCSMATVDGVDMESAKGALRCRRGMVDADVFKWVVL